MSLIDRTDPAINRRSESGVVLVIVLLMIAIIVTVTVELVRTSRSQYYEATNMRDQIRTMYVAKSGFYRAQTVLAEDTNNYDGLFEKWAKSDVISAQSAALFEDGYFTAQVEDESGKIPVNKLVSGSNFNQAVKDALSRLLARPEYKLDQHQIADLLNAIKDYIDTDTEATGAEKGTAEPAGYKNGPLESLEELLAIKGISENLFYGSKENPGIAKYLTVYGDGMININTAPAPVLKALAPDISDDAVSKMEAFRKNDSADLADPGWYHKIPGLSGINLPADLVTTRTKVFRITSIGYLGKMTQTVTGVVERGEKPSTMKILSWKVN
jgi:general secretion pathway protein K